jgi:UDP-N-acetylmuramate--alanine ligase
VPTSKVNRLEGALPRTHIAPPPMALLLTSDPRPVHFVGVAGAGMSALAELFVRRGARVTGCDANPAGADDLRALGVAVTEGHDPAHVAGARAVVVTSAMPKDHPELAAARAAGLPVIRRAEALAEAVAGGLTIGIAARTGRPRPRCSPPRRSRPPGSRPPAWSAGAWARGAAT